LFVKLTLSSRKHAQIPNRSAIMSRHNFAMMILMALAAAAIGTMADPFTPSEGFSRKGIKVYGTTSDCEAKIIAQGATMIDCWLTVVSQDAEGSDVCEFFEGESCNNISIGESTGFSGLFYDGFTLARDTPASPSTTVTVLMKSGTREDSRRVTSQSTDREYIKFPSGYTCKAGKKHRFPIIKKIGSLKNCEKECDNKGAECVAVGWNSRNKRCQMYKLCNKSKARAKWKMSRIVPENSNKFVDFPQGYNCDVSRVVADGQYAKKFGNCRKLCRQQADCKSFVWVSSDKSCYLKAPCDGGDLIYKDEYHRSASQQPGTDNEYYYIDLPTGYRCNNGGEDDPNKLGDEVSDVDSFGDCKNICNYNEECKGLSYNFDKNTCQLYSMCTDFNTQLYDESAVVHKIGDWLDLPNGWNLDCSTLETIVLDDCGSFEECFADCKTECEDTTGCTGITYNIDDKRCFLKPEQTNEACTKYEAVSDNRSSRMM